MAYSREIEKLERQFNENPRRFAAPFADALRKSAEVDRALEVIQVGLELNPDYIPGSVILGRCHLDLGNDDGAEAAFSRVLDLDNENVIALKSLADIMERQGRNEEAVRFLTYLLDVDRSNDEAREQLTRIEAVPVAAVKPPPPPMAEPETPPEAVPSTPRDDSPPAMVEEFLEPTALWEAPVNVEEAPISSWVETTSSDPLGPPEIGESLLDTTDHGADVAPVEGFEAVELGDEDGPAAYEEFVLEREEEIVLTSHSGAEYQVANDSEALLRNPEPPAPPEAPPEPVADMAEPEPVPPEEAIDEEAEPEPVLQEEPEPEEEPEPVLQDAPEPEQEPDPELEPEEAPAPVSLAAIFEEAPEVEEPEVESVQATADPTADDDAPEEESPLEWAMHVSEERSFVPAEPTHTGKHAPDSFDAAIDGIAPVDEETDADDDADDDADSTPEEEEPPVLVVTESMAELYADQGHPSEALGVYRILYDRNPDNERLRLRIQDIESTLATQAGADAAPSFAASVTGGNAVAAFLGSMLEARPAPVDLPEPQRAPDVAKGDEGGSEESDEAVASGAPTRPAIDRLSLGAIFGEDPSPVPPAENAVVGDKAEGAGGFSFDDFFGGGEAVPAARTSGGSLRAARPADDEDDLDQFHSWLQSLKR